MKGTTQGRKAELPLQLREAPLGAINVEKRTAELTWTSGAQVKRYDWYRDRYYLEELSLDPAHVRMDRLASGKAPLLDSHDSWGGIRSQIGVVDAASIKPPAATVRFSAREEVQGIFQDVQDHIVRNVSVGYVVHRIEMIPPTDPNGLWIYRAVDWEPYELSLVSIPADAAAEVRELEHARASGRVFPCEFITPAGAAADHQPQQERQTMLKKDGQQDPAATNAGTQGEGGARSAEGTQATTPATTPASPAAATAAGAGEGARAAETPAAQLVNLYRAAEHAGLDSEFVSKRAEKGESVETIRAAMVDEMAKRSSAQPQQRRTEVTITNDEVEARRSMVSNALLHRYDAKKFKLEEGAREWRGYTLRELMRALLEVRNINTQGMSVNRMWERTMESGSDLPNIVLDAANKSLRQAYDAAPRTYEIWARQASAPDFKNINRIMLSGAPSLLQVRPGEEFKRGAVLDGKETYALATFGRITGINRQTIINDDMDAFTRIPALYARAASDLVADTVYAPLLTNPNMADGVALFHATHANLSGSSDAISVTSLGAGRAALRLQKGLEGRPINIQAKYLLVPAAKETIADQQTSADFVASANTSINPFRQGKPNALVPVAEPRLDAVSGVTWFLAADPAQIDTIEYAFLEGSEPVYLESRMGFDIDGIEMKVRTDVAAKAIDYRGLYKNPGA